MHIYSRVVSAAILSKAVVLDLLLLIHLLLLPLFVGTLCLVLVLLCSTCHGIPSSFTIILLKKRELVAVLYLSAL